MNDEKDLARERVLVYLRECQKACPKGVSIKLAGTEHRRYLQLRFKIGTRQRSLACDCPMTMQGITLAAGKAILVAEALQRVGTETEFMDWYDRAVLGKNAVKNNLMTFAEAVKKLEEEYWAAPDRKHRKRDRTNVSQQAAYTNTYGRFFKLLPADRQFNSARLLEALDTKKKGTKSYGDCLYAFKKLAVVAEDKGCLQALCQVKHRQTEYRPLKTAELESFLAWVKQYTTDTDCRHYLRRKQWLWVFSMQVLYGFRIHEVFAIANIATPFRTQDGHTIPALRAADNKRMVAVVAAVTEAGTTTKTGYRLAAPMLPPSHPNLIEDLGIRNSEPPTIHINTKNPLSVVARYNHSARAALIQWEAPVTQTHALRHLCNQNGRQAGISIEVRAANLGHSAAMNAATYLSREATSTRLAAIDSMNAVSILPFEVAVAVLRQIGVKTESVALIAKIYGVGVEEVMSLCGSPNEDRREKPV